MQDLRGLDCFNHMAVIPSPRVQHTHLILSLIKEMMDSHLRRFKGYNLRRAWLGQASLVVPLEVLT